MLDHDDVRRILAAERAAALAAAFEPTERRPLRLRLGLWLVRPYAPAAVNAARARQAAAARSWSAARPRSSRA